MLDNLSENCYNVFNKVKSETGNINLEDVTLGSCSIVGGSQTMRSGKLGKVQQKVSQYVMALVSTIVVAIAHISSALISVVVR